MLRFPKAAQRGSIENIDFRDDRLYYILSDLNNGNVMLTKDGEIYSIDHCHGGFYPLCFMTFVAHQSHTVSSYLRNRLQLPDSKLDILERAASDFWPPDDGTSTDELSDRSSPSSSSVEDGVVGARGVRTRGLAMCLEGFWRSASS